MASLSRFHVARWYDFSYQPLSPFQPLCRYSFSFPAYLAPTIVSRWSWQVIVLLGFCNSTEDVEASTSEDFLPLISDPYDGLWIRHDKKVHELFNTFTNIKEQFRPVDTGRECKVKVVQPGETRWGRGETRCGVAKRPCIPTMQNENIRQYDTYTNHIKSCDLEMYSHFSQTFNLPSLTSHLINCCRRLISFNLHHSIRWKRRTFTFYGEVKWH